MYKVFEGKINGAEIKEGSVVLINVPLKKLNEVNIDILKWYISKKNYDAVYVTVNKPFSDVLDKFKKAEIDINKMFVIDAVSPRSTGELVRTENAVFVGSPKELTNISITTTSAVKKLKTAKIIIFGSINTLLFYNDFKIVKDFIHFISSKMRELRVTFAMICVKDMTDEKTISQLRSFVDEVIDIE